MSITIKEYDFRKVFEKEKNFLLLCGFYPQQNTKWLNWKNIRGFISFIITTVLNISMILVFFFGSFSDMIDVCAFLLTNLTFFFKLCQFIFNRNLMTNIEELLQKTSFYEFPKQMLGHIEGRINFTKTIGKYYRATVPLYLISIISMILFQFKKKQLPLPSWLPYDHHKYANYFGTIIFQLICIGISGYSHSSIDIISYLLLTITSCQFDILMHNLSHIDYNGRFVSIESDLKRNTKHHVEILQFFDIVNRMYTNIVLFQCGGSVLIICLIGVQTLVVPLFSPKFVVLMVFTFSMSLQVAFYCWQGHNILIKSSEVGNSCYNTNWYYSDVRIRKLLFIIMERSKRPVLFTAGGFFPLSMATLTMILKSSYSYFAVLQQMYGD